MSMRIHAVPKYQVEYGDTISSELTQKVIEVFENADSGWVQDSECGTDAEIDRSELLGIIEDMEDCPLKQALILLEEESDHDNDFVRFCEF